MTVTNTYPYTLLGLRRLFGGSIRKRPPKNAKHRMVYEWTVCGDAARNCITYVLPYLWEKREQALLLIELCKYPRTSTRRKKLERLLKSKKRINYTMQQLNKELECQENEHF